MQGDPEAAFTGQSLPIRGAWIEISPPNHANTAAAGRSPSGERGLKSETYATKSSLTQVAPHPGSVD